MNTQVAKIANTEANNDLLPDSFYVVAREPGAEHPALPTWTNNNVNPLDLSTDHNVTVERRDIPEVPGAFQLLNVLTPDECERMVALTERLGYLEDAAVSLPRSVRHNHSATWVVDETTDQIIWQRSQHFIGSVPGIPESRQPVGINARFRFYRYSPGDYFKPHTDGSWPGSRVINGELVADAYPGRWSELTFLLFLSENFSGGSTQFLVDADDPGKPARFADKTQVVSVRTPAGGVLCFPHGQHPMHCLHASEAIQEGTKYILRTDLLFEQN